MTSNFAARLGAALAGTHALIDLDAYGDNVALMRERVPAGAELMAVVKANAYGHGLMECGATALEAGASQLGVARIEEGLRLRQAGIDAPVLVLGPPNPLLLGEAVEAELDLAAGTEETLCRIAGAASVARPARVHLKIDSGMHRYGIEPEDAARLAARIAQDERLRFQGLFSHFATADESGDFVHEQIRRFDRAWEAVTAAGLTPRFVHYSNSAATIRGLIPPGDRGSTPLARCGYALYGLSPSPEVRVPAGFRPVLSLKSRLARVFDLPAGEGVSYGLTHVAAQTACCATLPVGYGDGLPRALSNRGWAVVRGVVCPIRGRVCMDQLVIEVAGVPGVTEGDEAVIYGAAEGAMTVDEAAGLCGTIGYEIVTRLSARLPRVYLQGGAPVAVSDLLGCVRAAG